MSVLFFLIGSINSLVHLSVLIGRIPPFQPCDPGSILGGVKDFILYFGTGCMSFYVFIYLFNLAEIKRSVLFFQSARENTIEESTT